MGFREERLEILSMVADGVISAEEGERLLAALERGRAREGGASSPIEEMGRGFAHVGRGFAGMGRTIATAVDQAVKGALRGKTGEGFWEEDPDLELAGDTILEIANTAMGDGSISIAGGSDRGVVLGRARVHRRENRVRIEWPGGDLRVEVPPHVEAVHAAAWNGDIRVAGLTARLDVRTHRGDLELRDLRKAFTAQTLRGDIRLTVLSLDGASRAATVAGGIEVRLGPEYTGRLELRTLGGEIARPGDLGRVVEPVLGRMPRTAVLELGRAEEEPGRATLALEAGKGGITVGRWA